MISTVVGFLEYSLAKIRFESSNYIATISNNAMQTFTNLNKTVVVIQGVSTAFVSKPTKITAFSTNKL